jgi:hypothetical protein
MREVLERHDGTVAKFIGDAVVGSALVLGDAVNVAARLEQAAAPGEVLLGRATWRLVRDAVQAEEVAPLAIRGKADRVVAWRLRAVTSDRRGHSRRREVPMVGRELEHRRLLDVFDRVVAERACRLVTVLGTAGVGKTRLVDEALADVGERPPFCAAAACPTARASPTGRSPRSSTRRPASPTTTPRSRRAASWLPCSLARSKPVRSPAGSPPRLGLPTRSAGRRRPLGRSVSCSGTWRAGDRWWSPWTTCTGRSRRCWTWSST